jgi:hypothetical protein
MSKTTNFEISKKLAEIGFKAETGFYWYEYDKGEEMRYIADADGAGKYKAYDLETLLNILPKTLPNKLELRIWFDENNAYIGYQNFEGFDKALNLKQEKNESLADTVGRFIILLHEKNLIKF